MNRLHEEKQLCLEKVLHITETALYRVKHGRCDYLIVQHDN